MGTCSSSVPETDPASNAASRIKRQYRSLELKRRIVEETLVVGASVARVARAHGVNANQVFAWRRLHEQGRLGSPRPTGVRLLPVTVADTARPNTIGTPISGVAVPTMAGNDASPTGTIDLEVGKARLRLAGNIDPVVLRLVLQSVLG